jgi:hypothetical protein
MKTIFSFGLRAVLWFVVNVCVVYAMTWAVNYAMYWALGREMGYFPGFWEIPRQLLMGRFL